jgi:hypothetical protein
MAAPKRNRNHPDDPAFEKSRAKIQTTQLTKRLQNYALNTNDDQGNPVDLDAGRIRAIEILLSKTLPSLSATDLSSKDGSMQPVINLNQDKSK